MKLLCKRAGHSNKTGEIYEVGKVYDVDPKNPRIARFFEMPPKAEPPKAEPKK